MLNLRKWFLALGVLVTLAVSQSRAQDRFWNPSTATADWDTTSFIWGTASGGPFNTNWSNGSNANLNSTVSGGSTATLTEAITTGNILFSGKFTIVQGAGGTLATVSSPSIQGTGTGSNELLSINTQILGATSPSFSSTNGGSIQIALNATNNFSSGIAISSNTTVSIGNASTGQTGNLTGNVALNASSATISFDTSQGYTGIVSGSGTMRIASPTSGSTTITLTNANTLTGPINVLSGSALSLVNNGTTTNGSITSASQINLTSSTVFSVTGHTSSVWTLGNGQELRSAGNTSTGGRILGTSNIVGTVSPGGNSTSGSTGALRVQSGNMNLIGGSTASTRATYDWSLKNATGTTAGVDFSQITGVNGAKMDLSSASSTNQVRLLIRSDNLNNFNSSNGGSWVIADFSNGNASGGIIGFAADKFIIDTSAFGPSLGGGTFSLSTDANSNQIILSFAPVPEPAFILGLGAVGLLTGRVLRRKFRRPLDSPV